MIAANVESARRMKKARIPGLYRVHEGPEDERLEELQLFLRTFGFKLGSAEKIAPKELNRIIEKVAGRPEAELIETVILRSLKQARYQPSNVGPFRPCPGRVRALHVADPPLSRPARASRDSTAEREGWREGLPLFAEGDGAARRAHFAHGAAGRRGDSRRRGAAQVHLSEGSRGRDLRRDRGQRRGVRPVRARARASRRRARARDVVAARLLPPRSDRHRASRRALRQRPIA